MNFHNVQPEIHQRQILPASQSNTKCFSNTCSPMQFQSHPHPGTIFCKGTDPYNAVMSGDTFDGICAIKILWDQWTFDFEFRESTTSCPGNIRRYESCGIIWRYQHLWDHLLEVLIWYIPENPFKSTLDWSNPGWRDEEILLSHRSDACLYIDSMFLWWLDLQGLARWILIVLREGLCCNMVGAGW